MEGRKGKNGRKREISGKRKEKRREGGKKREKRKEKREDERIEKCWKGEEYEVLEFR